jgi:eukaryotic-like serine/threonine-protein kinase
MSKSQSDQNKTKESIAQLSSTSAGADQSSLKKFNVDQIVDIEQLADDYVKKYRAGQSPSITQYIKKYPELSEEIQECFPAIAALEGLKAVETTEGKISLGRSQPKQLGDFRIIKEIGRGGMGVVYEAIQESLNRPVALKVLPRHLILQPKQLKRFKKEAKIAASLHHSNIVPVFGVGEDDGFHYYVMQLNNGVGLDELLQRISDTEPQSETQFKKPTNQNTETLKTNSQSHIKSEINHKEKKSETRQDHFPWSRLINRISSPEEVAIIGIQAAKALQYAHEKGILHRDIKPGNLLIDQEGIVRVTDFGLARAIEPDNLSMTEEIVGTLGYMAPEMLAGETIPQSDLYSLGITLYELLTKQVAFERSERSHIIDQIRSGSIKQPRSLNPDIPRDLETIILKAIAVDSHHRYKSAKDLEEDLKLFLEDRPIRARRVTPVERLWRWSRRNPVIAALSGLAMILMITIGMVFSSGYQAELKQRKRAEETAVLATESLDRLFNRFVPGRFQSSIQVMSDGTTVENIQSQPILSKESALLLTEMIGFYEKLALQTGEKKEFLLKTAGAQKKVGDIYHRLGDHQAAIESYQESLTSYQNLISSSHAVEIKWTIDKAVIQNEMGLLFRKKGESEKGNQFHLNALETLNEISTDQNLQEAVQFEIARTYFLIVQKLRPEMRNNKEKDQYSEKRPPFSDRDRPGHGPHGRRGPDNSERPGRRLRHRRRHRNYHHAKINEMSDEHQQFLIKATTILKGLTKTAPQKSEYQYLLALCLKEQIPDTFVKSEKDEKIENRVISILENLVKNHPKSADYRLALVNTYENIDIRNEPVESMTEELIEQFNKAIPHAQQLASDHPTIPTYKITLIHAHNKLATVLEYLMWEELDSTGLKYLNLAEQSRRTALRLQKELVVQFPDSEGHKNWLCKFHISLASVISERGNHQEAITHLDSAIPQLKQMLKNNSGNQRISHELVKAYHLLAGIYRDLDDHEKSREYRNIAEEYKRPQSETSRAIEQKN